MLYFLLHQIKYDILPKNLSIKIQPINNDEIEHDELSKLPHVHPPLYKTKYKRSYLIFYS